MRTRLVFEHLVPVIHRYARIIFRLVYQSSLPSATDILFPRPSQKLTELFLTCTTYDLADDDADDSESDIIGADDDALPLGPTIPTCLNQLSLTGFDFMRLCRAGSLKMEQQFQFRLSITHYKFRRHFAVLPQFLHNIADPDGLLFLLLTDISLAYQPSREITSKHTVPVEKVSFSNVSADFISALFSAITFADDELQSISFQNCAIPRIGKWDGCVPYSSNFRLELSDIPFNHPTEPLDPALRRDRDDSLYNAIEAFPVYSLRVCCCEGVNDHLLRWISGGDSEVLEVPKIQVLELHDCTHFTSQGACALLVNRQRRIQNDGEWSRASSLASLEVLGRGPAIYKDDIAILDEHNSKRSALHTACVSWNVESSDSHEPGWVTDLRPLTPKTFIHNWDIDSW